MDLYFSHQHTIERHCQGPLGKYIDLYAKLLRQQGFRDCSARPLIILAGEFSRWLDRKRTPINNVDEQTIEKYRRPARNGKGFRRGDAAGLRRLLTLLRQMKVVYPRLTETSPRDSILAQFGSYLAQQRRLTVGTIKLYSILVGRFLTNYFKRRPIDLSHIQAIDVIGFVRKQAQTMSRCYAKNLVCALRAFLRYLQHQGQLTSDLAAHVPTVSLWSLTTLPKFLPRGAVKKVLRHCDRRTALGRRDYAMLLLLARLGLRASEVTNLKLEDIDWAAGMIVVHGKGNRSERLPLPADVGKALAMYLRFGRPVCETRRVFVRHHAPHTGFAGHTTLSVRVRDHLARAGINSACKGAHVFRHTLATDLLRQGCSLDEIGELLRHRHVSTTAIYAKVDLAALRSLAMPWPGGAR